MDSHVSSSSHGPVDTVILPAELWQVIFEGWPLEAGQKPAVALTPRASGSKTLVAWASQSSNQKEQDIRAAAEVLSWLEVRPTSFPCKVAPVELLQLSTLYLQAATEESYAFASSSLESLLQQLSEAKVIIRQGALVRLKQSSFTALLCDPVLQGLYVLRSTQVTVLAPSTHPPSARPDPQDDVEIDESFLERSLIDAGDFDFGALQPRAADAASEVDFECQASPLRASLYNPEVQEDDPSIQCYASTAFLAQHGLLAGDWILLSSLATPSAASLARVWASTTTSVHQQQLQLHPMLLYNLCGSANSISVRLHQPSSKFTLGSLPIAQSVTLTRISSSISISKDYQPLFLDGLKRHLAATPRVLRKGDWIAVAIDSAQSRWSQETDSEQVSPFQSQQSDAIVFFRVESCVIPLKTGSLKATDTGKLGFILSSTVTQVIQAGVEPAIRPPEPAAGIRSYHSLTTERRAHSSEALQEVQNVLSAVTSDPASQLQLSTSVLLQGASKVGKATLARTAAAACGLDVMAVDAFSLVGDSDIKTEGSLRARFDRAMEAAPCVLLIQHIEALARKTQAQETGQESRLIAALQECITEAADEWQASGWPVVLVATTSKHDTLPAGLLSCFKTSVQLEAPDEKARFQILANLIDEHNLALDVDLAALAMHTAALLAGDLTALVQQAAAHATFRASKLAVYPEESNVRKTATHSQSLEAIRSAGVAINQEDFQQALESARTAYSESIGAPKIPNVTWDDVGGLGSVKTDILDTVQLPLQQPELFASGLKKRSGILLYGPPGTGKTLLAKAVATSCALNFFSVKGPELLNMYIGESEANVRRIFQRARDAAPCVIFFDELDSIAPKRGNQGDAGGVMDRIVSQLLAELDGMGDGSGSSSQVFVIGATNRPDLLDPALLRPGRFDRMLYLGVSQDHEAQLKIIQALTRKFRLTKTTDLAAIAQACPFHLTGADFYALCSDAMLKAMTRTAAAVDEKIANLKQQPQWQGPKQAMLTPQYYLAELAEASETEVLVSQDDFLKALSELSPSVSVAEMDHYAQVQKQFASASFQNSHAKRDKGKGKAV